MLVIDEQSDAAPPELPLELLEQAGVARLTYLKEIGSTNTYVLERLAASAVEGPWLVAAERQTAGRGRGDNRWWSGDGGLTFTLAVDAEAMGLPPAIWPRLSMAVGIALCRLLERSPWNLAMQIKWPNDVYVGGKKLGGILIEHWGTWLVIGVGLNVNQEFSQAPPEVQARATSLLCEMGAPCSREALLADAAAAILAILPETVREEIDFSYEGGERNFLQWRPVVIRQGKTTVSGRCEGIDFDGALLVRSEQGLQRVLSGTVELTGA